MTRTKKPPLKLRLTPNQALLIEDALVAYSGRLYDGDPKGAIEAKRLTTAIYQMRRTYAEKHETPPRRNAPRRTRRRLWRIIRLRDFQCAVAGACIWLTIKFLYTCVPTNPQLALMVCSLVCSIASIILACYTLKLNARNRENLKKSLHELEDREQFIKEALASINHEGSCTDDQAPEPEESAADQTAALPQYIQEHDGRGGSPT